MVLIQHSCRISADFDVHGKCVTTRVDLKLVQLLVVIRCTCDQLVWDLDGSSSSRAAKGDLDLNKILTITSMPNKGSIYCRFRTPHRLRCSLLSVYQSVEGQLGAGSSTALYGKIKTYRTCC